MYPPEYLNLCNFIELYINNLLYLYSIGGVGKVPYHDGYKTRLYITFELQKV